MAVDRRKAQEGGVAGRFSRAEADVARRLQGDLPLEGRPFLRIAAETGLSEAEVLSIATRLRSQGLIRKFGAIVRHQRAGYTHNLMVVWAIPGERSAEAGRQLAAFPEITHCYERVPPFAGKYNLFTMIHFQGEAGEARLREIAAAVEAGDFQVLRSVEEFKKSSMEYF